MINKIIGCLITIFSPEVLPVAESAYRENSAFLKELLAREALPGPAEKRTHKQNFLSALIAPEKIPNQKRSDHE